MQTRDQYWIWIFETEIKQKLEKKEQTFSILWGLISLHVSFFNLFLFSSRKWWHQHMFSHASSSSLHCGSAWSEASSSLQQTRAIRGLATGFPDLRQLGLLGSPTSNPNRISLIPTPWDYKFEPQSTLCSFLPSSRAGRRHGCAHGTASFSSTCLRLTWYSAPSPCSISMAWTAPYRPRSAISGESPTDRIPLLPSAWKTMLDSVLVSRPLLISRRRNEGPLGRKLVGEKPPCCAHSSRYAPHICRLFLPLFPPLHVVWCSGPRTRRAPALPPPRSERRRRCLMVIGGRRRILAVGYPFGGLDRIWLPSGWMSH
jgi:hypothetical protein